MLLTLTEKGRNQGADAAASLRTAGRVLVELNGTLATLLMTYGQYDATIVGDSPSEEALTQLVAWINEQGYFSTQTQIGVEPETFTPAKHVG
ncbi:MAG: GYD domain-containing protein [Thermoleophilia bacterium]